MQLFIPFVVGIQMLSLSFTPYLSTYLLQRLLQLQLTVGSLVKTMLILFFILFNFPLLRIAIPLVVVLRHDLLTGDY
jgi:hypothetical protein